MVHATINYQLSTINYQLSTINYQLSTINYQLSTIDKSNADRNSIRLITPMLITSATSLLLDTRIAAWVSRQMIPIHKPKTLEEEFCLRCWRKNFVLHLGNVCKASNHSKFTYLAWRRKSKEASYCRRAPAGRAHQAPA